MLDVYEDLRLKALAEFEEFDKSEAIEESLNFTLPNTGDETDYEAWSEGCDRFAEDNYDALKGWLQ